MTKFTAAIQKPVIFYDAQNLGLLVFIFKVCLDQILAKLISQGVAAAPLPSSCLKNFGNEKNFLLPDNC